MMASASQAIVLRFVTRFVVRNVLRTSKQARIDNTASLVRECPASLRLSERAANAERGGGRDEENESELELAQLQRLLEVLVTFAQDAVVGVQQLRQEAKRAKVHGRRA